MSKNLKLQCKKFVPGHAPQSAGDEFASISEWCKQNEFARDYYGKGKLIESFEKKIADLLGFESGCFMPSGTMAQQITLKTYSKKSESDCFAIHPTSHLELHEEHGYAELCNLKSVFIGDKDKQIVSEDVQDLVTPISTLILELPAREIGGQLPTWQELKNIKQTIRKKNIFLHMDGARLWETKAFYKKSYKEICAGFDSVYVSFYKGIGGLTGAMLLGDTEFIKEARIWLRRFGGNLYQMHPYVASAAMRFDKALLDMPKFMKRTTEVYKTLKDLPGISFRPDPPQVNMFHLHFNSSPEKLNAARDKIAKKDKIWLVNNFRPADTENSSYTEIYVGEGLMDISDEELFDGFSKLCR